jgi:hypothetical protein
VKYDRAHVIRGMEPLFCAHFQGDSRAWGSARYQNARRLPAACWTDCFGRVCMSPQISTAPKTTNIATTQTATSNDSVGMGLTSCDGGSMPARLHSDFDLSQF